MDIYHYDSETHIYLGKSTANESPLENGVYLIPRFATSVKIQESGENEIQIFDETLQKWVVHKYFVGETWYDKDTGNSVVIDFVGDPLDKNLVKQLPIEKLAEIQNKKIEEENNQKKKETEDAWNALRQYRNYLLLTTDFTQAKLKDVTLTDEQVQKYAEYRQKLRDLPQNTTDPKSPDWPIL